MTALWTPTTDRIAQAGITDLMAYFNAKLGRSMHDYSGLHKFSVHEPESFWDGVWDHAKLIGEKRAHRSLSVMPCQELSFIQNQP